MLFYLKIIMISDNSFLYLKGIVNGFRIDKIDIILISDIKYFGTLVG